MQDTMEQAQEKVREAGGMAKDFVRNQVDAGADRVGQQLKGTAEGMRSASAQLRDRGNPSAANVMDALASRADQFGDYLLAADAQQLFDDLQEFTRQRPWLVASAGLVVGFAAARMLKAANGDSRGFGSARYRSYGRGAGEQSIADYGSP